MHWIVPSLYVWNSTVSLWLVSSEVYGNTGGQKVRVCKVNPCRITRVKMIYYLESAC